MRKGRMVGDRWNDEGREGEGGWREIDGMMEEGREREDGGREGRKDGEE